MSNKYQLNPQSLAESAVENARTSSMIETMREKGATDEEITKAVFGDMSGLVEDIVIVLLLKEIIEFFGFNYVAHDRSGFHPAMLGYACIAQHYTYRPEAVRFENFRTTATTVRDIWEFYLQESGIEEKTAIQELEGMEGYNAEHFQKVLDQSLTAPGPKPKFSIRPDQN